MNTVSNVVSISGRLAPAARSIKHAARPGPLVLIVERPKTYAVAAVVGAIALVVGGVLTSDLLRMPRSLACEAVPASPKQASYRDLMPLTPARLED